VEVKPEVTSEPAEGILDAMLADLSTPAPGEAPVRPVDMRAMLQAMKVRQGKRGAK